MSDVDEDAYIQEIRKLVRGAEVTLKLTALEAWIVMAQLQLALRCPGNDGSSAYVTQRIARTLQDAVASTPLLRSLAEMGWDPQYDVPADAPGKDGRDGQTK